MIRNIYTDTVQLKKKKNTLFNIFNEYLAICKTSIVLKKGIHTDYMVGVLDYVHYNILYT